MKSNSTYTTPRKNTPATALHSSKDFELKSVKLASRGVMEESRTSSTGSGRGFVMIEHSGVLCKPRLAARDLAKPIRFTS